MDTMPSSKDISTIVAQCQQSLKQMKKPADVTIEAEYLKAGPAFVSVKCSGTPRDDILNFFKATFQSYDQIHQTLEDISRYLHHEPTTRRDAASVPRPAAHKTPPDGRTGASVKDDTSKFTSQASQPEVNMEQFKKLQKENQELKEQLQASVTTTTKRSSGKELVSTSKPSTPQMNTDQFRNLERENQELKHRLETSTREILIKEICDGLEKPYREKAVIQTLTAKAADFIDRLAAEMNTKVSANESTLENISIKNRPMNVAEVYSLMMSNAWLEAKTALDEKSENESRKVTLLCDILLGSESRAKHLYGDIMTNLSRLLQDPLLLSHQHPQPVTSQQFKTSVPGQAEGFQLPASVVSSVGDVLRNGADNIDLSYIVQNIAADICSHTDKRYHALFVECLTLAPVNIFMEQSARLAWKMITQRPSMQFDTSLTSCPWSAKNTVTPMYGSNPRKHNAIIRYYKQPSLVHGKMTMVKGEVYVG